MKQLMIPLRVSNVVMTGKIPIDHKFNFADFITGLDGWFIINEELSPIAQKQYERHDGTTSRRYHNRRKCRISVSIWPSGAINIVGLRTTQEGEETLKKVINELESAGIL